MDLHRTFPPPHLRPRRLLSCHLHPDDVTPSGLCPPCLLHRLSLLNPQTSSSSSSSELRRCKTFSEKKRGDEIEEEPRRYSCDVRVRSSLWTLFNIEDEGGGGGGGIGTHCEVESRNLGFRGGADCTVLEDEEDEDNVGGGDEIRPVGGEIRVSEDEIEVNVVRNEEIGDGFEETKTLEELLELESKTRKASRRDLRTIAGDFLSAASVKLRKLRRRRKNGGRGEVSRDENLGEMEIERLRGRRLRETQSEIGEYGGFGRRSCDTDDRRCSVDLGRASVDDGGRMWLDVLGRKSCDSESKFSIDLGRASVDGGRMSVGEAGARCSFEPARASWDGPHFNGRNPMVARSVATPTVSVIENAMATVYGFHNVSSVIEEKLNMVNGDGAHVNRSWQRQRKGFDHCKVRTQEDESRLASNGKISPANIDMYHGARVLIPEKEMKDSACVSSLEDDSLGSSESASKDIPAPSGGAKHPKKRRQWSKLWNILGILQPKTGGKCGEEEKFERGRVVDCPLGDSSWKIPKLVRSFSSNNARGPIHGMSSSSRSTSTTSGRSSKRRDDPVVERYHNRSSRYSPGNLDNGLLRFNLTPLKTFRRRSNAGKGGLKRSPSMARTMFRLY
ncbi:hypothetical protein Drorol1_Dr00019146 [Drosera rotundifolia]